MNIGVGIKGTSYNENYEQARAAIDLALGRGGDQVVVKNGEDIAYFGGKAKQVERNTRVEKRGYRQEQLAQYQQLAETPEDVYTYLERYDIPNSMVNVMAASEMLRKPNRMMERLFQQDHVSKDSMTEIAEMKEQVLEQFSKALENPSDLADAMETLADVAEHVMDTMIVEDPDVRTIDIREMRQMTAQFQIGAKQSQEECYVIPMQTGDSVTGVSLKIVRGKRKRVLWIFFWIKEQYVTERSTPTT